MSNSSNATMIAKIIEKKGSVVDNRANPRKLKEEILQILTTLIPAPIKDIIFASKAARKNPEIAAERLIISSIRIAIAAIGLLAQYKFLINGPLGSSDLRYMVNYFLPMTVVYIASVPAGTIMFGLSLITYSSLLLSALVATRTLKLISLSSNLFLSGICITYISIGWMSIHLANMVADMEASNGSFSGYLERYINNIAQKYRASVATFLYGYSRDL